MLALIATGLITLILDFSQRCMMFPLHLRMVWIYASFHLFLILGPALTTAVILGASVKYMIELLVANNKPPLLKCQWVTVDIWRLAKHKGSARIFSRRVVETFSMFGSRGTNSLVRLL